MTLATWMLFCATETVLCFTPGPAVLLVISLSLSRGAKLGVQGSLGILAANAAYFALSATSLGAVLVASWQIFFVIKWLGAGYLVWLGSRMVFFPSQTPPASQSSILPASPHTRIGAFWSGLFTQAANPKALVFFTALLPQFINPEAEMVSQVAILGVSSVLIEFVVLCLYVLTCTRARAWAGAPAFARPLERVSGAFLIAAGARLAAVRRS